MRAPASPSARRGFTLVELLLAVSLTAVVFAIAIPFLTRQSRATASSAGRLDAAQNARFAQDAIDRDLRMVGVGTLAWQPMLVQADNFAVTFNADLTTRDENDGWAIYYDPDADSTAAWAMQPAQKRMMPRSLFAYPDTAYVAQGVPGRAETISYWLQADVQSGRPDEYVLWRRVNGGDSSRVTSGLYVPPGKPFFSYTYVRDTLGNIDVLPETMLPVYHWARTHGGVADSGATAREDAVIDRIRAVRVLAVGAYKDRGSDTPVQRSAQGTTTLVNAALLNRTACGLSPEPVTGVKAVASPGNGGNNGKGNGNGRNRNNGTSYVPTKVTITWSASPDETGGERDVERYLVYRSRGGEPLVEPIANVPAGSANKGQYTYDDFDVQQTPVAFRIWQYSVVAQDCQPQISALATASAGYLPTSK